VRESLRNLVALHRVDDDLAAAEAELAALPGRRAAAEARLEEARERVAAAREALEARQLEARRHEAEAADAGERIRRWEAQKLQVKSNEEYRALEAQQEQARSAGDAAEERALEAMDAAETLEAELARAEEALATGERAVAEELARLEARAAELAKEWERLRSARDAAAARLEAPLLARYQKAVERRRPGVAVVSGEVCSGCSVGIPPQAFLNLLSGQTVEACGSCRRILVHASVLDVGEA